MVALAAGGALPSLGRIVFGAGASTCGLLESSGPETVGVEVAPGVVGAGGVVGF